MKSVLNKGTDILISEKNVIQITFVKGTLIVIYEDGTTTSYSKESLNNCILNIVDEF